MSITEYLNNNDFHEFEGYSQEVREQVVDLIALTKKRGINVMEIGFSAGHSAEIFLQNNPNLMLTSFDLGLHNYVRFAKQYIDLTYPNRHTLIIGNSTMTIPTFINQNKDRKFDVIFIDGGNEYEIVKADLANCFLLAHKDTIVIMDDTMFTAAWSGGHNIGPTRAWTEYLQENRIVELGRRDYCGDRGMSWGKYVF